MIDNNGSSFLPDLCQITRFCDVKEIGLLQEKIRVFLNQDLLQMTEWTEESHFILLRVTLANFQELSLLHKRLNEIESERFLLTNSVSALHHNCTHYRDVIATRTMELVAHEMCDSGWSPPHSLPYALLSMGSDGRKEQTLITDQDYLLVYGDNGGEDADLYFEKFSALLVDRLEETGFKKCTGDIMPTNPTWRGSFSQWRKRLLSIVRYEFEDYAKNMMDLIVLSDARYVAGDKNLAEELALMIRDMERDYFRVLWGMAKAATEMRLALGFLKRIWTESSGEHKGEFNLKLLAWAPLVMNIRILAINQGVPATSTVERISMLEKEGSFSAGFSDDLHNAYLILTKHRILLQIKVLKGIQKDSYYLNPFQLPTGEIEKIHNALLKIEELQKIIHSNFSIV
ncbi:putative nucleotidyltransferase substrate binding domain-containing protein [Pelotalea chapellei]|uniref:Nucleotidyltransferase n=1 Tax=Pelotalea chapellei TaxID=44671 RepID=A0ABS5U457_9BACT|nr:putative nucleotidyltransferase substrate binding domain-containing protein [Pelotalea chapellei]MBT1070435.1 nucleotidyltransferase [Pelotalea chapellei]